MRLIVDASIALKWVIREAGSLEAEHLLSARFQLMAPDLIVAELANALWQKVRRAEITAEEALVAARGLEQAPIELTPMRGLIGRASELAHALDQPAYDCFYLALAVREGHPLVTADAQLSAAVAASSMAGLPKVLALADLARV
jgi:predicted nucleic acid-binding protein